MTQPTRPPSFPDFRQGDKITNPALFALARARWPGTAITAPMLADAAKLTDAPLYVPATDAAVAAGLAEIQADRRRFATTAAGQRALARMGFDPTHDYRSDKS